MWIKLRFIGLAWGQAMYSIITSCPICLSVHAFSCFNTSYIYDIVNLHTVPVINILTSETIIPVRLVLELRISLSTIQLVTSLDSHL